MAKQPKFIVTSPVAEFGYAYLRTPDTQFNPEGDYKVDFYLDPEKATEFCKMIESDPRAVVKGKRSRVKATKVDGKIKFRSKQHALVKNGKGETFEVKPQVFHIVDGKTEPYPEDAPPPFMGSTGEVEVEVVPYEGFGGGLTLRLRAVRLHEVVSGASGGSRSWSDVAEGYTSSSVERDTSDNAEVGDEEDEGDDDSLDRW